LEESRSNNFRSPKPPLGYKIQTPALPDFNAGVCIIDCFDAIFADTRKMAL
jgi:hypothetical protein